MARERVRQAVRLGGRTWATPRLTTATAYELHWKLREQNHPECVCGDTFKYHHLPPPPPSNNQLPHTQHAPTWPPTRVKNLVGFLFNMGYIQHAFLAQPKTLQPKDVFRGDILRGSDGSQSCGKCFPEMGNAPTSAVCDHRGSPTKQISHSPSHLICSAFAPYPSRNNELQGHKKENMCVHSKQTEKKVDAHHQFPSRDCSKKNMWRVHTAERPY